ncbi:MAG: hypothetical protein AB7K41_07185 [Bdellovibrionales bacterium]
MAASQVAAIEFISKDQVRQLSQEFASARAPKPEEIKALSEREIKCDMYGVRTRLQVERDVRLYHFKSISPKTTQWDNQGAQVVQQYQIEDNGLIGRQGTMKDEVRLDKKNQVVAELSLLRPASASEGESTTPVVLAYSKCRLSSAF